MLELCFLCWLAFKSNYLLTYVVWLYAIVTPKDDKTRLQHKLLVCEDFWPHLHAHQTHFGSPAYPHFSMTQHLSHTFAHLTGQGLPLRYRPNYCPINIFLVLRNLHKSCWKLQNSDFQSQFSKLSESFSYFFWRISI